MFTLQVITSLNSSVLAVFGILNAAPLNCWYQRPCGEEREFNASIVLTKRFSKSFLCHIPIILVLQNSFWKDISLKTVLFLSDRQELYIQIMMTNSISTMHSTSYKNLFSLYIYTHSLITLSRAGPYVFFFLSVFFSRTLNSFYCFHRDVLEFIASGIFIFWKRGQQNISKFL